MPTLPSGSPLTPFSGVQGIQVLKHAADSKSDAVKAVLQCLLSPDMGIALAKASNCAPVNLKAFDDPDIAANEMIVAMRDTATNVVPMPNVPEMDVMWAVLDEMLSSVNKSGEDVATACQKAQDFAAAQIEAMK
jgi:arabinogalactan oligomer/maltooligosaccharide transport system substrate-binding protein